MLRGLPRPCNPPTSVCTSTRSRLWPSSCWQDALCCGSQPSLEAQPLRPSATAGCWWPPGSSVFQVVQLVLGVLSGILGGFLYIYGPTKFCYLGAAIWTGAVAVLAGVAGFLYEKRGGICWALLRTLLILASFCTAIAAIVIGASYFHEYYYFVDEDDCKIYSENWPTKSPITPSPKEVRRQNLCISQVNMLKALVISLQAMLMGVWVLLLLASLAPLCLYCWRRFPPKKKRQEKKLLGANGI
ncbi:transmembrane protein 176A isoform X2 [Ictidomys tridecemlineatus]